MSIYHKYIDLNVALLCMSIYHKYIDLNVALLCMSIYHKYIDLYDVLNLLYASLPYLLEDIISLSIQHSMAIYVEKIIRGYLEKRQEHYKIPDSLRAPSPFASLTPDVTGVVLHDQGPDPCIVVEGINLWFCYYLKINEISISIPPNTTSGTSIRVTIPDGEVSGLSEVSDGDMITIVLDSHFCASQSVNLTIHKKVIRELCWDLEK